MATPKEAFVPHASVPGPPRLDMALADNSGTVNTDIQFIADRQAIINKPYALNELMRAARTLLDA